MTSGVTAGVNISYDEAFKTRVSADLKVRFGGASTSAQHKEVQQQPVVNALTSSPSKRDIRVHDISAYVKKQCPFPIESKDFSLCYSALMDPPSNGDPIYLNN